VTSVGITTVVTGTASILRAGSLATIRIYNEAGELVYSRQQAAGSLQQSDIDIVGSLVDPSLGSGQVGGSLQVQLGGQTISWSGVDASGKVLANGEYLVEVTLESGGQTTVITETITVLSSRQLAAGGLQLNPNPVAGNGPVEIRVPGLQNPVTRIRARVYTVSGELVRYLDAAGDNLSWDLKDASGSAVSAGLYLLLVQGQGPEGDMKPIVGRLVILR